jgi:hypothetical protein
MYLDVAYIYVHSKIYEPRKVKIIYNLKRGSNIYLYNHVIFLFIYPNILCVIKDHHSSKFYWTKLGDKLTMGDCE